MGLLTSEVHCAQSANAEALNANQANLRFEYRFMKKGVKRDFLCAESILRAEHFSLNGLACVIMQLIVGSSRWEGT